jgi:membrane associated rhomboid family serine protease
MTTDGQSEAAFDPGAAPTPPGPPREPADALPAPIDAMPAPIDAAPLDDAPTGGRDPMRESRVSKQLRELGRLHRDIADDSDTLEGHPPLRDDDPLPEIVPRHAPASGPALPPIYPRRMTWLLLLALVVACWATGLFAFGAAPMGERRFAELGGLVTRSFDEPWRLVLGTFVHQSFYVAVLTGFMVFLFGGEVERRVGSGVVLFVVVVAGVGLNAARVASEPPMGLLILAGGWPAGLALGGAALALSVLAPAPGARRSFQLLLSLGLDLAILLTIAYQTHVLTPGLQAVLFLSVGAGLVLGLALAVGRGVSPGVGVVLGGVALATVVAAQAERERSRATMPAPPWEPAPVTVAAEDLEAATFEDLKVRLDLPSGWREAEAMCEVKCPGCLQEVKVPAAKGPSDATVECPACEAAQVKPRARNYIDFTEPRDLFGGQRTLRLWSGGRGPFDAADTLATRIGAQLDSGSGFLSNVETLVDRPLGDGDPAWLKAAGWRSAWVLVMRGQASQRSHVCRMYFLVGERRTVQIITIEPDEGDGAANGALFDAIARSVRELP